MTTEKKVWLVTGASRGMGVDIAKAALNAGHAVVGTARNSDTVAAAVGQRDDLLAVNLDVTDPSAAEAAVQASVQRFGRIDVLVNNAGLRISKNYGEYSEKDFDQVVAVNLKAPFLLGQAVVPAMKVNGGGRIINIASQMGLVTDSQVGLYGLTKAALIYLTKSMAFELAPHNIIVNAVSPGPIMTEFNAERVNANPALKARRMSYIRAGRYGRAEEVAEVVAFLASSKGTYMLGENIVIDGGYVVH